MQIICLHMICFFQSVIKSDHSEWRQKSPVFKRQCLQTARGGKMWPWPFLCLDCLRIEAGELIRSLCNAGFVLQVSLSMLAQHAILTSSIILFSYNILLGFFCIWWDNLRIWFTSCMTWIPLSWFLIYFFIKANKNYLYLRRRIITWIIGAFWLQFCFTG